MSPKKSLLLGGLLAASLAVPTGLAFAAPEGDVSSPNAGACPVGERLRTRHEHRGNRARIARRALRVLDLTDAQKEAVRSARQETAAERDALRGSVRALRERTLDGERSPEARKAMREEIRGTVRAAADRVAPVARRLVDGLSSEQRARLEEKAKEHGKTLDDERLLRLFERLLLAPGPAAR